MSEIQELQTEKNQDREYRYFAFISYCREDEKWARWLQKKLETYRLPSKTKRENKDIPKRMVPIFRDKTDLAGIVLEETLRRGLEESQYLIVICSPNSVKSDWVNEEIAYFRSLGRETKIIPFSIEGVPFSDNPEEECLPSEIRKITPELLSINVADFGRREAFVRLVATMLNLLPDELIKRETVRRYKRIAGLVAAGLIFLIAGFSAIWHNTEHSEYYVAYTTKYEVPVGINKLSSAEQKNRANSYRITKKRGQVVRLEMVNGAGNVCTPNVYDDLTDHPILEYNYDSDKRLIEIKAFDTNRHPVVTKQLSYGNNNQIAIDYRNSQNSLQASVMDSGYDFYKSYSGTIKSDEIIRQINTYNKEGYCVKTMYYRDSIGTPARDGYYGVYGKEYTYTADGQISHVNFLDRDGNVCNNKYGYAGYERGYDSKNNIILWEYRDLQNKLCSGEYSFAAQRFIYDEFGNLLEMQHFSEENKPCNNHEGIYTWQNRYEKGYLVSQKHIKSDNQPTTNSDGVYEIAFVYDSRGRNTELHYYDTKGQRVNCKSGKYASMYMEYNKDGMTSEWRVFDATEKPCFDAENGVHIIRQEYTSDGKVESVSYYDVDGKPRCSTEGYAACRIFYNDRGLESRYEYYDVDGKLKRGVDNYAAVEYGYDPYGNNDMVQYYDENNKPCYSSEGISRIERTYENGNEISERYYDSEKKPMLYKGKYHEIRDDYDENGNCIKIAYYDTEGRLTECENNYAYVEYEYDDYGNAVEERFFDRNSTPSRNSEYYHRTMEYDSRGNLTYEKYEAFSELNFYSAEKKYDEYDNLIQLTYYDKNGDLLNSDTQYAIEKYTYDEKHNQLTYEMHYTAGRITTNEYEYDSLGNLTFSKQFETDTAGMKNCVAQIKQVYDTFGNLIRKEYMDGNGNLQLNDSGYAVEVCEYSPEGYIISYKYYDENEKPILYNNQFFRCRMERDIAGNITKKVFYDENEELLKEENGFSAYQLTEYNAQGKVVYEKWLNENKQPVTLQGWSSMRNKYNELGELTEKIYYDAEENLIYCYVPYAFVYEVHEGSQAQMLGIQQGDMIICWGNWCEFSEEQQYHFNGLKNEIYRLRNLKKEILLYGIRNSEGQFIPIEADDGLLGIGMKDGYIEKKIYEEIKEKYKKMFSSSAIKLS